MIFIMKTSTANANPYNKMVRFTSTKLQNVLKGEKSENEFVAAMIVHNQTKPFQLAE